MPNKGKDDLTKTIEDVYKDIPDEEKKSMIVRYIFSCCHEDNKEVDQIKIGDVYKELTRGKEFYESDIYEAKNIEFLANEKKLGLVLTKEENDKRIEEFVQTSGDDLITVDEAIDNYIVKWPKSEIDKWYAEAVT